MKYFLQWLFVIYCLFHGMIYGGGLTAGLVTGWNPDILHFNRAIAKTQIEMRDCIQTDNSSCKSANKTATLTSSSSQAAGIPIGFNVRYLEKLYLIRLGFNYHFSTGGKNIMEVINKNPATGIEEKSIITEDYDMRIFEFPLTFAFNIRNDAFTRLYAGAGPTVFYGSAKITHDNGSFNVVNGKNVLLTPDEDLFKSWSMGAHMMVGGEVSMGSQLSLSMELWFNYGSKSQVMDVALTQKGYQNIQQEEDIKSPEILGVYNNRSDSKYVRFDPEHPDGLDFTGIQFLISVNYFLGIL